jgi:hypothetical protein
MKTGLLACLASLVLSTGARAATYPPGPGNAYPDTLNITNVQNPAAIPHPSSGDVVLGVGGIVTGFVDQARPFGFYVQLSNGGQWSGIGVYTGNVFHGPGSDDNFQLGDSVVVYAKVKSYQQAIALGALGGNNEINALSFESSSSDEDLTVRKVSSGNALPPFHVGPISELEMTGTNPAGRPWEGALVRVNGPLKVMAIEENQDDNLITLDGNPGFERFLILADASCTSNCQLVKVDCSSLVDFVPPPVGTTLGFVRGVFDRRQSDHLIQLRSASDLGLGNAPVVQDAFPIYDNDLPGGQRIDSVMVVFDVAVQKASAENVANYSLASGGTIDGALRLDAPQDNRVVLKIRNGLDDGASESITVGGAKSLSDGTAMFSPQTFDFYNGVLELEKVRQPDANALAGNPCDDRSRFSGADAANGGRASFTGTVTGKFGEFYTLQGTTLTRGGVWVNSPAFALTVGHAVLLAGAFHEVDGETQGTGLVYARDLGVATVPNAQVQSVPVLIDETCDAAQLFLTGLDHDGMLITLDRVVVTQVLGDGSFYVATPGSNAAVAAAQARMARTAGAQSSQVVTEQILVVSGNFPTTPQVGRIVTVTGVVGVESSDFAVFPRNGNDVTDYGDVPTFSVPLNVSKSATMSRDPDIVKGVNGELFMSWGRVFHESVHSLSLDLTQNWSLPLSIMHQGVQPALAVTPSNKFGVLNATPNELLYKQSTDGGIDMDAIVTTVDAHPTSYPALTVGEGEHFHAAWERQNNGIFYGRSLDGGATFSEPVQISTTVPSESNTLPRIGASTGDNVFIFWNNHQPGEPGVDRVLYSRSLDGGSSFSVPRLVRDETNPLTSVIKLAVLGDVQVGPDGTVYVMGMQQGPGDSVAFLKSTNGGFTFKLVGHVTKPSAEGGVCAKSFALGPNGEIHAVVGICGTALYYTRSNDGGVTWGPAVDVSSVRSPTVGEPRGAKIILDGTGTPVIVWYSEVGGSTEIFSARLLN